MEDCLTADIVEGLEADSVPIFYWYCDSVQSVAILF